MGASPRAELDLVQLARETGSTSDLAACLAGLAWLEARMGREAACRAHAAEALGLNRSTFLNRLAAARAMLARQAREGHAPGHFDSGTAPGYLMGKVTVQRNASGDVERTCADVSRARALLGYAPTTRIEQGIPLFVEWFRSTRAG